MEKEGREEKGRGWLCFWKTKKNKKFRIDKDIARLKEHPDDCTRRDAE